MNTVFILLMLWGGYSSQSGIAVVQQEFSSLETCEAARRTLERAHQGAMQLRAQGCFKK